MAVQAALFEQDHLLGLRVVPGFQTVEVDPRWHLHALVVPALPGGFVTPDANDAILQGGDPPRKYEDIRPESAEIFAALHRAMLGRGVMLAPSAYEVMFVSLAHDPGVIEETVAAFEGAVKEIT